MPPQREWFEKDYYKVLGVAENAPEKDITRAYRTLAKQFHPDTNLGSEERFKEISAAYDVLGKLECRKEYDAARRRGPLGAKFARNNFSGPGGIRTKDLSDLLESVFSDSAPPTTFRGASSARSAASKGVTLEAEIYLSFEDSVKGAVRSISVTSDVPCGTCGGTGAAPGTSLALCRACAGKGLVDVNQGTFSFYASCTSCQGSGTRAEQPCANCRGLNIESRVRTVKVRVPTGVQNGQRISLRDYGGAGRNGGPPGDLLISVHVASHAWFKRKGLDITLRLPVTFPEAALGATVLVPTLDGPIHLKIPAGSRSGKTFRVRGRGFSVGKKLGDLLVTISVVTPHNLTAPQRAAIESFQAVDSAAPRDYLFKAQD